MLGNWWRARRLVAVFAVAAAVAASADTLIPLTFEQIAGQAEFVVVGRVVAQESRFNDERTMILTHTTIAIDDAIVGDARTSIEISEYGGRVGNLAMVSSAQVIYEEGEQVLVFVCRDALGLKRTCGAQQGRMSVKAAADGATSAVGVMAGEAVRGGLSEIRSRVLGARVRSK